MKRPQVTMVVQRYGADIVGGAEQLARAWAALLATRCRVRVLSTTAADARSWRSQFPAGPSRDGLVRLLRFAPAGERTRYFDRMHALLTDRALGSQRGRPVAGLPVRQTPAGPRLSGRGAGAGRPSPMESPFGGRPALPIALEREWLRAQGPWCPDLESALRSDHTSDRFLFFSYLYPTTVFGLESVPAEKAFLVPTLHDELPAYFETIRSAAARARDCIWISKAERDLGHRLWGVGGRHVLSMPLDPVRFATNSEAGPDSRGGSNSQPGSAATVSLLYCGRIDPGKGLVELIEQVGRFRAESGSAVRLELVGRAAMPLPRLDWLTLHGFVSEERKLELMRAADIFVMPSPLESLSITLLEALAVGTPALVNGRSAVLLDHIRDSGGGRAYRDYAEFRAALLELLESAPLRTDLGRRGQAYARKQSNPETIRQGLLQALQLG